MKAPRSSFHRLRRCLLLAVVLVTASARSQTPDDLTLTLIPVPYLPDYYRLTFLGQNGKKFQVQSSADLTNWSDTGPVITGGGGTVTINDGPINDLRKFYRVGTFGAVRLPLTTGKLEQSDDGFSHTGSLNYHPEVSYILRSGQFPAAVPIGFTIKFSGVDYGAVYVNNNGNVTFNHELQKYTPLPLKNLDSIIIAPFWADVDTRSGGGGVLYSSGASIDGHICFAVTWPNVGYYSQETDKLNRFQLVLIERADVAAGDFDVEFNYDKLQWETGDQSQGTHGLGGSSARVGISDGSNQTIELAGSSVNSQLLDTALSTGLIYHSRNNMVPGRYVFQVRAGVLLGAIQINAGADQILAPNVKTTILSGSASDPGGPLTYQWALLSDPIPPGTVTFSNATVLNSSVTFSTSGKYTLQLTATSTVDPQRTAADAVVITVQ